MAIIYDSRGRRWGGSVDAYPDRETLAALIEEDGRLALLIEKSIREYGEGVDDMAFRKFGTGDVIGEDQPEEEKPPYEFIQREGERLPSEIRTTREDGSTGPVDSER